MVYIIIIIIIIITISFVLHTFKTLDVFLVLFYFFASIHYSYSVGHDDPISLSN